MSASINDAESVEVAFEGQGEVELTLPKAMIDGIASITAGGDEIKFEQVDVGMATTVRFTVPQDATIEITGARVVPEFGELAAVALAASLGIAMFTRSRLYSSRAAHSRMWRM